MEDALAAVAAGADAVGVNFVVGSPRRVDMHVARSIVEALPARVVSVGVFVDASEAELREVLLHTGLGCVQLHGDESPELLSLFLPHAYKAIRVRGRESLEVASRYAGEHILLDAFVAGVHGGTGASFDWTLAAEVARSRLVTLAGGLSPSNVAEAVRVVRPYCVDVASGVESAHGRKDAGLMQAFVAAAKGK